MDSTLLTGPDFHLIAFISGALIGEILQVFCVGMDMLDSHWVKATDDLLNSEIEFLEFPAK